MGFKSKVVGGVHVLSGSLDEASDWTSLARKDGTPLKLNLEKISRFNSIGIGKFLKFLDAQGASPIEYHSCSREFIDLVNIFPELLGKEGASRIKSLRIPMYCVECDEECELTVKLLEIALGSDGPVLPERHCMQCGGTLELAPESDDFFMFMAKSSFGATG